MKLDSTKLDIVLAIQSKAIRLASYTDLILKYDSVNEDDCQKMKDLTNVAVYDIIELNKRCK